MKGNVTPSTRQFLISLITYEFPSISIMEYNLKELPNRSIPNLYLRYLFGKTGCKTIRFLPMFFLGIGMNSSNEFSQNGVERSI